MKESIFLLLFSLVFCGFSQERISEEIPMANGNIQIPGELTYPNLKEKIPLVIFVHGSGNVDRNGNQEPIIKADYIKLLAESLNEKGIAFYRYDKRTAKKENLSKLAGIRFEDLVSDVQKVIGHFAKDSRFSGIHLVGHSQGSLVAMLAANSKVKSYVSLAGPGESIGNTIIKQLSMQNKELADAAEAHLAELKETDTIQKVNPFLMQLFAPQNQKFIKSWMKYNPSEEIAKIKKPILIVQGEMDGQVTLYDANVLLAACTRVNSGFGAPATLVTIKNMNHVLKTVSDETENKASYFDSNFQLSTKLVNTLVNFINAHG